MELKQRTKTRKEKNSKGITLIALVITIIVLLILAGVSIAMLTGENGILSQAAKAKNETEKAQANEALILDEYNKFLNNAIGGTVGGETTPPATDGSWSDEKGVNTPVIKENMELVKWDGTQFVPDETNSSYDYNNQQWANAKVTIDGVESYFVWIPRYEYKITYYTDENKTTTSETSTRYGTIDIKFIPTSQTTATEGYTIHPAFTNDVENGGWDSELPGIWVGKYETARSDSEGATQGTSTTIKV